MSTPSSFKSGLKPPRYSGPLKTLDLTSVPSVNAFDPVPFRHHKIATGLCGDELEWADTVVKPSAIELAESYMRYNVSPRDWTWVFELSKSKLRNVTEFRLPRRPVLDFTSFTWTDEDNPNPVAVTEYERFGDLIRPTCCNVWPCGTCLRFTIVWEAGYADVASVPKRFQTVVMHMVREALANPEMTTDGAINELPWGAKMALDSLKSRRN